MQNKNLGKQIKRHFGRGDEVIHERYISFYYHLLTCWSPLTVYDLLISLLLNWNTLIELTQKQARTEKSFSSLMLLSRIGLVLIRLNEREAKSFLLAPKPSLFCFISIIKKAAVLVVKHYRTRDFCSRATPSTRRCLLRAVWNSFFLPHMHKRAD